MQELTRRRIMRKLEALPDAQLYQVFDYIEFLESKYAAVRTVPESAFERFAERVEDGMRARAVAVGVMSRTIGALGTASRLLDDLTAAGREVLSPRTPTPAARLQPGIGSGMRESGTEAAPSTPVEGATALPPPSAESDADQPLDPGAPNGGAA